MSDITLGKIPTDDSPPRDAIHVAVAMVHAMESFNPGDPVLVKNANGFKPTSGELPTGIVDPFLKHKVPVGTKFWLLLTPKTATDLRHEWTHPAFPIEQSASDSEDYQDDSCKGCYD